MPQRCLVLELTGDCTNACKHCYNFWRGNGATSIGPPLSAAEILTLVKKVNEDAALESVALSGGEPLLREDFPQILGGILDMGLQPAVITNGVLLNETLLQRLPRETHYEVTLLGHTAELHNRLAGNNVFDSIIRNIAAVDRYGSYVTMAFVATRFNALDIKYTVELGLALGVMAVLYNRVNLSRKMRPWALEYVPPAPMLRESLRLLQATARQYDIQTSCTVPVPPCVVDYEEYPDIQFGFCPRGGKDAYYTLGCDGTLRPCNHSSLVLGDLRRQSFREILETEKTKAFWRVIPENCRNCDNPLSDRCRGGCTASAAEYYGTQTLPDPFCELSGI